VPELSDDELLLNRYADGELTDHERTAFETRLEKDAGLRTRLAELVSLNTALEIGISQTKPEASEKVTARRRATWAIGAAAGLLIVGAGTWWGLRVHDSSRHDDPFLVIEHLASNMDSAALRAQVTELLDPSTTFSRRSAIYETWWSLPLPAIEPLVWAMAQREEYEAARQSLYMTLTIEKPVEDYRALIAAARREWNSRALRALAALMPHLRAYPCPESEALVAEVLAARKSLPPAWIGERLPTIQAVARESESIDAQVKAALQDPDEIVRAWAGLARAGNHQRDGIECAKTLLRSENEDVRALAAATIRRHGLDTDIPSLIPLVNDPSEAVRSVVRPALAEHDIPIPSNP
jgi:anti-sigma factor RsiW